MHATVWKPRAGVPLLMAMALAACSGDAATDDADTTQAGAAESRASLDRPWLGLELPPAFDASALHVLETRPAAPPVVPTGEEVFRSLAGASIRADLETIVGFSRRSRRDREIGDGSLWGRITGLESGSATVDWAVSELRASGIAEVELQRFRQNPDASLWLPLSWEVRLVGEPRFGAGTADVVLGSAMPLSAGSLGAEGVTAPLVYVGTASAAELARLDVRGKVAVQRVVPQGHTVFVRSPVGPRSEALLERGALAGLTLIDLPGNMRVRDIGCGGGACFNLGGRDGRFLESVLDAAAEAGLEAPEVRLSIESERRTGLSAMNGVATLPGTSVPDEYVVVNAHADAWFDGAGDNGDGLAVLLALADHFADPARRLPRSLVFVVSAGHHTPGLSGPSAFLEANPEIAEGTVLVINLEHTAQRHITPARSTSADGYREWTMGSYEAPIVAGVAPPSPFIEDLVSRGIERYGTNFVSAPNPMASGEGGAFRRAGLPVFTTMQGPPMYHSTGEVVEMVSVPGMERMARFMAFFIEEVARADRASIGP